MKFLVNEQLGKHRYKTKEGYLVCVDAIIARTGKQDYKKNELFTDAEDDETEISVDRPYKEVFDEKTIASFENKPFVDEHPEGDVNVDNYRELSIGYIRDVHEGTDDGKPVLLANIIVTDPDAINEIENNEKNQLSCGYDCDIKQDEKGNYYQSNIRGNHLALCETGRAGNARIQDSINDYKRQIVDRNKIVDTSMTVTTQVYIFDGHNILIQNRKGHTWTGLAVPGGHVKHNEPTIQSAIREVKEETGLDVKDLVLFGTHQYTCPEDGESIAMLYYTTKFSGELKSSEEGEVSWMNIENVLENPDAAEGFTKLVHNAWTKVKNLVKDSNNYNVYGEYVDKNGNYEQFDKYFSTYQKALDYYTNIMNGDYKYYSIDMEKDGKNLANDRFGKPNDSIVKDSYKDELLLLMKKNHDYNKLEKEEYIEKLSENECKNALEKYKIKMEAEKREKRTRSSENRRKRIDALNEFRKAIGNPMRGSYDSIVKDGHGILSSGQWETVRKYAFRYGISPEKLYNKIEKVFNQNRDNWNTDQAMEVVLEELVINGDVKDSIKDDMNSIDKLISDEEEAIKAYEESMKNASVQEKKLYAHIMQEEIEHLEELRRIKEEVSNTEIHDVNPKEGETKEDFLQRFMRETESEYPDRKQRFAVANSYWERKDSIQDAPYFNKGRRIPAHNTYGNRISQDELLDTFKTVMKTGSDEDVDILVGQLIELKKDYLADINDKDLDLTETKKYYSKYKQIAKSYLNSKINQKFTKAVNEFVNSIKDSVFDENKAIRLVKNIKKIKDWSMKYRGHTIEEVFFSYYDDGHYSVDGNNDKRYCFDTLEEAKAYIRQLNKK